MRNFRKNKISGITLIALVVTIIVLLILAGISIMMLTGNNGILIRAGEARDLTGEKQIAEMVQLAYMSALTEGNGQATEQLLKNELDKTFGQNGYKLSKDLTKVTVDSKDYEIGGNVVKGPREKITKDKNGTTIAKVDGVTEPWLPSETAEILVNKLDEGLTIKDEAQNEYVWVEVPKSIYTDSNYTTDLTENAQGKKEVTSATDYDGIYKVLNKYAYKYRKGGSIETRYWQDEWYDSKSHTYDGTNWYKYDGTLDSSYSGNVEDTAGCGLTRADYITQYQRMLKSVYTNGGFWIGRYEAGITDSRSSRLEPNSSPTPLSQSDKEPYTYVYCSDAQILAERVATEDENNEDSEIYTSSLMFGIQWDLVCKFLEESAEWDITTHEASWYINTNSSSWGNYKPNSGSGSRMKTGKTITPITKRRNIYDFAGNVVEWTLTHAVYQYDLPCEGRGGSYFVSGKLYGPASKRSSGNTITGGGGATGFRVSLDYPK